MCRFPRRFWCFVILYSVTNAIHQPNNPKSLTRQSHNCTTRLSRFSSPENLLSYLDEKPLHIFSTAANQVANACSQSIFFLYYVSYWPSHLSLTLKYNRSDTLKRPLHFSLYNKQRFFNGDIQGFFFKNYFRTTGVRPMN